MSSDKAIIAMVKGTYKANCIAKKVPGDCTNCKHSLRLDNDDFMECSLDGKEYDVDHTCEVFEWE